MTRQWRYFKDEKQHGPLTSRQLKELAASGVLQPEDLVKSDDTEKWRTASSVSGLFQGEATPQLPPPVEDDTQPESQPAFDHGHSEAIGLEDAPDLGINAAVKSTVDEFKSLDFGFLVPFKKIFSKDLMRKKAVRWVIGFGLFPLILVSLKDMFEWTFEQSAWFVGGYFCLFWAAYFHGILKPHGRVWQRGVKWAGFTVIIGLPLLFIAQRLPIIRSLYAGTESTSLLAQLLGFILGVAVLEEVCKAIPLLYALRKNERFRLKTGIFLGMMSGFGFALAEVVQYSMQYWGQSAALSAVAIAEAVDSSTTLSGQLDPAVFRGQMEGLMPDLTEVYGSMLLVQIVRFMTLPLLHACWAGVVGWFVATASQRSGGRWPTAITGIAFVAILHGLYDVFSDGPVGIGFALITILVFMGYLMHGEDIATEATASGEYFAVEDITAAPTPAGSAT